MANNPLTLHQFIQALWFVQPCYLFKKSHITLDFNVACLNRHIKTNIYTLINQNAKNKMQVEMDELLLLLTF